MLATELKETRDPWKMWLEWSSDIRNQNNKTKSKKGKDKTFCQTLQQARVFHVHQLNNVTIKLSDLRQILHKLWKQSKTCLWHLDLGDAVLQVLLLAHCCCTRRALSWDALWSAQWCTVICTAYYTADGRRIVVHC